VEDSIVLRDLDIMSTSPVIKSILLS